MRYSVFTPTHNISHISETAQSLRNQTALFLNHEIEWLIGYNNGITEEL